MPQFKLPNVQGLHAGVSFCIPAQKLPHWLRCLWFCMLAKNAMQALAMRLDTYKSGVAGSVECAAAFSRDTKDVQQE